MADSPGTAEFHAFDRSVASPQLQEAQRKHDLLVEHLHKDQEHKRRLVSPETAFARARGRLPELSGVALLNLKHRTFQREFKERIQQQKMTQNRLREHRQQSARAKKYYDDYHVQHRARLMRMRTKEERVKHSTTVVFSGWNWGSN